MQFPVLPDLARFEVLTSIAMAFLDTSKQEMLQEPTQLITFCTFKKVWLSTVLYFYFLCAV